MISFLNIIPEPRKASCPICDRDLREGSGGVSIRGEDGVAATVHGTTVCIQEFDRRHQGVDLPRMTTSDRQLRMSELDAFFREMKYVDPPATVSRLESPETRRMFRVVQ